MSPEILLFWLGVSIVAVTSVVLVTARSAGGDPAWRRVSRLATVALVAELLLAVGAVLFVLSFDDRWRF